MAYYYITVSQQAEQQAFIVSDVDGVKIITSFTTSGLATGAVFGTPGAIIGAAVGAIVGTFFAIFGDKKKGAMNLYRATMAEILGQVDPGSVIFNGEHAAVTTTRPADPNIMLDITRQMLQAYVNTFDYGSDDYNDAMLALNSVQVETIKPCCNRTIIQFEGLDNATGNVLSNWGGISLAIALAYISK